jgi:tetratricopeptide (TPR) repeat protein
VIELYFSRKWGIHHMRGCLQGMVIMKQEDGVHHAMVRIISPEVLYLHRYANELASKGRFQEAISFFDRAIESNPENSCLWNDKGVTLEGLNRTNEAVACYDKAIEHDLYHAEAWFNKGVALRKLGRSEECVTCQRIASCLEQGRDVRVFFRDLHISKR